MCRIWLIKREFGEIHLADTPVGGQSRIPRGAPRNNDRPDSRRNQNVENRLSAYVRPEASGETVLVAQRGRVVAELDPPDQRLADAVRNELLTSLSRHWKRFWPNSTTTEAIGGPSRHTGCIRSSAIRPTRAGARSCGTAICLPVDHPDLQFLGSAQRVPAGVSGYE